MWYTIPNGSIKSILYTNALIGLSLLWPSHAAHLVTSWSPAPGGWCLVSRDSASVTLTNGLHFPRCPNFQQNKISFPPSSGVVWCVLWTSQAINLYWIYHDNCRPPRWVNIKIYLPTTITRDFYHDHWQLRLSCQRLHLSPDSRTLSRASYCLCDAVQRMASVIFMPESVSLFSSHQFTFP